MLQQPQLSLLARHPFVYATRCCIPIRGSGSDHDRFRRLLVVALMRAREINRGVLLAAKPGWSYDHARLTNDTTRRLMESIGFVVHDRHA